MRTIEEKLQSVINSLEATSKMISCIYTQEVLRMDISELKQIKSKLESDGKPKEFTNTLY